MKKFVGIVIVLGLVFFGYFDSVMACGYDIAEDVSQCYIYGPNCSCKICPHDDSKTVKESSVDCDFRWSGYEIRPEVKLYDKQGGLLVEGEDYTLSYRDNVNVGNATIIVNGTGKWTGQRIYYFHIKKAQLGWGKKDNRFEYKLEYSKITATGSRNTPKIIYIYDKLYSEYLTPALDYEIVGYSNNINASTKSRKKAKIYVRGLGDYAGDTWKKTPDNKKYSAYIEFEILPVKLEEENVELSKCVYSYTGKNINPSVTVKKNGKVLKKDKDYKLKYINNKNSGTAHVQIQGIGVYSGTCKLPFVILKYKGNKPPSYKTPGCKKGAFIYGNYVYGITNKNSKKSVLICPTQNNMQSVTIKSRSKYSGVKYSVDKVLPSAFISNRNLKKVTIERGIQLIGEKAFYNCSKLELIIFKSNGIVKIGKNAIKGISPKAVIKVHYRYKKAFTKVFTSQTGYNKKIKIKTIEKKKKKK